MFCHLHMHTEYSLLDGANRIKDLIARVKSLGMTSCAITDHGVMYGVVDFYKEAKKEGIHPVIGCEVYVCRDMDAKNDAGREMSHLILLCENQTGYQNLIKLVSEGFTRGFYYRPRIDYDLLKKHKEGLIALSACLSGDLPKAVLNGRMKDALSIARMYQEIFGKDHYYIELQNHGLQEQKQVLPGLIRIANDLDIPLVITNDCHYTNREDAEAQEILMCIQTGKTLKDENRMRMETDQMYIKSEDEIRLLFPDFDDAIQRTEEIARRCHVEFDFDTKHLPAYPLPGGETAAEMLRRLCTEGLMHKYAPERTDARKRLDYELTVIETMGYVDYFLIVWDFINYAKRNGILVGPGRGSGAGSIVAYTLDITAIDPIEYSLLFERFLNPERVSMPDLDIDFDYERRGEVIEYVQRKYGSDHVAQIITFGTMAARLVLRDVGRVMDLPYGVVDQVAKMVPFELNMTLQKALEANPDLKNAYEGDEDIKKLIDTGKKLEGMPRHASTHAAGVLITAKPVSDYVPLQTNDQVITTQFPMGTLEALGLLKMDFLGLRTLNVVGDSLELIRENGGPAMDSYDIPMDDAGVYQMISSGDTDGVFQLESGGMRNFLMNMKPQNFEDIIAAISLYRPGPMDSIPRFIQGKHNPATVKYLTPKLEPILDVTYGCMVYQEQVMQIVRDLAGYSMGRSDLVRRAMAKKKHDVMEKEKEYFINGKLNDDGTVDVPGAIRMGVSREAAEKLFDEMTAFASYAFNKSHAAAYGVVAVQTGWLKKHYPTEFMAALINSIAGSSEKVAYYIEYCRKNNIEIAPPDVNRSMEKFSVDTSTGKKKIRFGLNAVKNVGHGAIRSIIEEREKSGDYKDLFDFAERNAGHLVNKKAVESLIKAGAFDSVPGNRAQKMCVFEKAMDSASKKSSSILAGQISLFGEASEIASPTPPLPPLEEFGRRQILSMEKEVTGIYVSGHPLEEYASQLSKLDINARYLAQYVEEKSDGGMSIDQMKVKMGGILTDKRVKSTKSGGMMAIVNLEDLYGSTEVLAFPRVYERVKDKLIEESVVVITGRLSAREDETPKLLIDTISPLGTDAEMKSAAQAVTVEPEKPRKLYLKLTRKQLDAAEFILETTPGSIPVYFYFHDEQKTFRAPMNLWVSMDYDKEGLEGLLGAGSVVMK
ncbi:MAG: DNA polymerase III subunit alpha [Clostridia bacterium]|nr:DNA polymerase III subunit alpha [Clostridia bacterium]